MTPTPELTAVPDEDTTSEETAAERRQRLMGPGSPWYETLALLPLFIYGSIPYLIMPTQHPKIAHVLGEHETAFSGAPLTAEIGIRRMVSTYEMVAGIVYAGSESEEVAHGLYELHRPFHGDFPESLGDGKRYHAWNADMWTWTWGSIMKAGIDLYRELYGDRVPKGWTIDDYLEASYQGGVELGKTFGVQHLPATYVEFEAYWDEVVTTVLAENPQARTIVDEALHPPKFSRFQWIPDPIWTLATLPVTQVLRAGILMGVPESTYPLIGFEPTRMDRVQLLAHKALWRSVPRPAASKFAPTYFTLRRKFGTPLWRTEFSRATLAEARGTCPHASAASSA